MPQWTQTRTADAIKLEQNGPNLMDNGHEEWKATSAQNRMNNNKIEHENEVQWQNAQEKTKQISKTAEYTIQQADSARGDAMPFNLF